MGTHISRVKSVDLDSWTDEQLQSVLKWGNARANKLVLLSLGLISILMVAGTGKQNWHLDMSRPKRSCIMSSFWPPSSDSRQQD